jgi:hypothetical protein
VAIAEWGFPIADCRVPIANFGLDSCCRLHKIGNRQLAHSPKVRILQLVMSRFFVGDDFSGMEVLNDRWWPDAMGFAFPNGAWLTRITSHAVSLGSLVIGRATESDGLWLVVPLIEASHQNIRELSLMKLGR